MDDLARQSRGVQFGEEGVQIGLAAIKQIFQDRDQGCFAKRLERQLQLFVIECVHWFGLALHVCEPSVAAVGSVVAYVLATDCFESAAAFSVSSLTSLLASATTSLPASTTSPSLAWMGGCGAAAAGGSSGSSESDGSMNTRNPPSCIVLRYAFRSAFVGRAGAVAEGADAASATTGGEVSATGDDG